MVSKVYSWLNIINVLVWSSLAIFYLIRLSRALAILVDYCQRLVKIEQISVQSFQKCCHRKMVLPLISLSNSNSNVMLVFSKKSCGKASFSSNIFTCSTLVSIMLPVVSFSFGILNAVRDIKCLIKPRKVKCICPFLSVDHLMPQFLKIHPTVYFNHILNV